MKTFKQIKDYLVPVLKEKRACYTEFKRIISSKTKKQLLIVLKDNSCWCDNNLNFIEVLDLFGDKLCAELNIFYKGEIDELKGKSNIILYGDVLVKMLDNSTVARMFGNSTVTKMFGNSTVTEMFGNSTVTKMLENSTVTKMCDNSTVTEMFGNSTVTKMWDNSTVTKMLGNSTVTKMLGNSTVTEMWDNSTVTTYHKLNVKTNGARFCIIDYSSSKIIVGSDFEVIVKQ